MAADAGAPVDEHDDVEHGELALVGLGQRRQIGHRNGQDLRQRAIAGAFHAVAGGTGIGEFDLARVADLVLGVHGGNRDCQRKQMWDKCFHDNAFPWV